MTGIGGHHKPIGDKQVWLTPRFILDALGPFDCDPCAAPEPRPWPTARVHITEAMDGLRSAWQGRVWLNPPYDRRVIGTWLDRLADHGIGTALLFARTETDIFFRTVWARAEGALFLRSRLTFCHADGTPGAYNGGAPSVLVAYGAEDAERLIGSGLPGHFVSIAPTCGLFVFMRGAEASIPSWREVVVDAMKGTGGSATLRQLYDLIGGHPKVAANQNWQAKIRQVVQRHCRRVGPATYSADQGRAA